MYGNTWLILPCIKLGTICSITNRRVVLQAVGVDRAATPRELSAEWVAALVLLWCLLLWEFMSEERAALSVMSVGLHLFGEAVVTPATVISSVTGCIPVEAWAPRDSVLLLLLETVIVRQVLLPLCVVILRWLPLESMMKPRGVRVLMLWSVSSCAVWGIQGSKQYYLSYTVQKEWTHMLQGIHNTYHNHHHYLIIIIIIIDLKGRFHIYMSQS